MNYYNEFDPKAAAWLRELIAAGLIPAGIVDTRSITEIQPYELANYTQCHFFAGIGGWSLALQLAGWPSTQPVWTGSCPCQPFSTAGKQLGTADERHLWPVFFNLIRECRPESVFGEQVASAIGKGWLDGVSADLEAAGYACGAAVLGAHSVGAPHIRQRLFWVADADGINEQPCRSLVSQYGLFSDDRRSDGSEGGEKQSENGGLDDSDSAGPQPGNAAAEDDRHGSPVVADGRDYWQRVSFAADCLGGDEDEPGNECSICGLDYSVDCQCPGPTQDGYDYQERDGILYARRMGDSEQPRLEGHAGYGDHRNQPGRLNPDTPRPVATAGRNSWSRFDLIPCADGKARRIEPGLAPLAHGIPARVVRLRGYGNAIVPQVAAEFVSAFLDVTNPARSASIFNYT